LFGCGELKATSPGWSGRPKRFVIPAEAGIQQVIVVACGELKSYSVGAGPDSPVTFLCTAKEK
jgi:hypothetical protein